MLLEAINPPMLWDPAADDNDPTEDRWAFLVERFLDYRLDGWEADAAFTEAQWDWEHAERGIHATT